MIKRILAGGALIVVGVLIPFLVLFSIIGIPEGEPAATWFQRSGSILVVLSIFTEMIILQRDVKPGDLNGGWKVTHNVLILFAGTMAIIGTAIWGYGDFLA